MDFDRNKDEIMEQSFGDNIIDNNTIKQQKRQKIDH